LIVLTAVGGHLGGEERALVCVLLGYGIIETVITAAKLFQ
jgi:hypothetical protein